MLRWASALVLGTALLGGVAVPSTAQAGQWLTQNGYSYYRGDDGRWYYYGRAGNCFVWDGAAWQPCAPPDAGYVEPYLGGSYGIYGYSQPNYGYSLPYYGYSPYTYGYLPYRNYAYVAPFGGFHHHDAHFHVGVPGHIHTGIGHVGHGSIGHGGHVGGHVGHGGHGHR
jgi:hypothetical protein